MGKQQVVKAAVTRTLGAYVALAASRAFMGFEKMIERYQIANAKSDFGENVRILRATKVLVDIRKREKDMRDNGLVPLSNYQPLADIFHAELSMLTEQVFVDEANEAISRDLAKATKKNATIDLSARPEVEQVIIDYHTNKAKKSFDQVEEIRLLLTEKGLLSGSEATNVKKLEKVLQLEAEKKETAQRVAVGSR